MPILRGMDQISAINQTADRLAALYGQAFGGKPAGRYREFVVVDNQRVDLIHMDCLAREFTDPDVIFWGPPAE